MALNAKIHRNPRKGDHRWQRCDPTVTSGELADPPSLPPILGRHFQVLAEVFLSLGYRGTVVSRFSLERTNQQLAKYFAACLTYRADPLPLLLSFLLQTGLPAGRPSAIPSPPVTWPACWPTPSAPLRPPYARPSSLAVYVPKVRPLRLVHLRPEADDCVDSSAE